MNKLFVALPFLLLTACTAGTTMSHQSDDTVGIFTCSDDSTVVASYSDKADTAFVKVTLPKVGLSNQPITLEQAVSGSGMRYVNAANPDITYEWQAKADDGIMQLTWANGQEYSVVCRK